MTKTKFSLDQMRIASPCTIGWENMTGDERVRFCRLCSLHVYNISEMTGAEVRSLVENSEGRVCARLYRRADGTVLTRDCPAGLQRAARRRVARAAGATLAALVSLCSTAFGQTTNQKDKSCPTVSRLKIKKKVAQDRQGVFGGVVTDEAGAVLHGVKVTLTNERTRQKLSASTTDEGKFSLPRVPTGEYTFEAEAAGFKKYKVEHVEINSDETAQADVILSVDGEVLVGILIGEPMIIETNGGTTTIRGETLRNLPIPE